MKASKKTDSVPGDIPSSILKEFLPEFASPVTSILKEAVRTHEWPTIYKREYHLPLKKVPSPLTEDDIRGIGLTSWVSKQLERQVLNWIWPFIKQHMDPDQMGGVPGCSIEHYIVKMLHFILGSMDGDSQSAVMGIPVDYSKAYNRMLHSNIITTMSDLKNPSIPTCAIRLIKSYLTQRSMCIRYLGVESSFEKCPGGGPQGGLLTGLLFCLQVNKAGSPCQNPSLELPVLENNHSPRMEELEDESLRMESSQGHSQRMDTQEMEEGNPYLQESYLEDAQGLDEVDGDSQRLDLP